ncbi:Non-specific lipid-transfer protein [Actinidia chinensis var. chinensis]|uniref:Non-specific lipid-transfer protein n=1 Tax=Actinidia chinensis var. chinensis TaxID=1590841 RepID=A0A2R6P3P1_ACTCC|nr:Non-specific lipid-transfer protein [Actinidia chinensis var. chinensis]
MKASHIAVFAIVLVLVLFYEAEVSVAVTCSPTELSSCASAISSGTPPSSVCCAKLKEQKPCLCQYIKNPNLKQYVNSPNAKKVLSTCGVTIPKCN